ncbi:hypothetical protein KHO49_27955 [Pseudomonas sp. RC4D1]|uniref:hypothetical protein n=1 Tax=Pseudomonas sp. RC4D1 TaxID=2834407 RepID=UPI001BCF7A92|nr:hypothetical protein [Pseudomonas sp. RC4D1]MBS7562180.1 hypothetical protein [Pseudomonas sp. RC4D1]
MSEPESGNIEDRERSKELFQTAEQYFAMVRAHRRRKRAASFRERNPLAWYLDEFPAQDMYKNLLANQRSTQQEVRYHWLRQRTGWIFWSQLKTTTAVRFAAFGGLVSAFYQAVPGLHGEASDAATTFGWLLLAGLTYLVAVFWYEIWCPLLLKQTLSSKPGLLENQPSAWLRTLVEDELRRWWSKREWWPHPDLLNEQTSEDRTAKAIMSGYGVPAFAGFDSYACAHIERALFEYCTLRKVTIWRKGDHPSDLREFTPTYGYEGNRPLMHRLTIHLLNEYDIQGNPQLKVGDLVLNWHRCPLGISSHLPNRRSVNIRNETEGLDHLFSDHTGALTFAQTIAFWQNTMHPIRRLILMGLYFMSGAFFITFVVLQLQILLPKMF